MAMKIEIRCSEDERTKWRTKAEAAGMSLSELVRQALSRVREWTAKDKRIEREKILQLARIGNNLNQIAKWANTHKAAADAVQVCAHLVAIEEALRGIKDEP